jgi:hypothetical protein
MLKAKSGKRQPVMRRKGAKDNVPAPKEKGKPGLMIMIGAPKKPPMADDDDMDDEAEDESEASEAPSKDMQLILAKLDALSARLAAIEAANA